MANKDIKTRLENLNIPEARLPGDQKQIKLAVMSAKKSAQASLWLLSLPVLLLLSAMLDSFWHISVPPWSLLKTYSHFWPLWVRMTVFITAVMVIPLVALLLNMLSIIWLQYDRGQKVLNISIRIKPVNIIIIIIAGLLAALFIGHAIADSIAGHD